jgi:hypothetical protein
MKKNAVYPSNLFRYSLKINTVVIIERINYTLQTNIRSKILFVTGAYFKAIFYLHLRAINTSFSSQVASFYNAWIQKLMTRYDKCLSNGGNYVEK